jgi:aspartyl-tRNA(Asn)/glutamyl-tRNA(Gln) amidotransferase subunit C
MAVTRDDVAHIAQLARLALDEDRVDELVSQLNGILAHMDVLRQVETDDVEGTSGIGEGGTPLRPDEGPQIPLARPRDSFAPAMRDGFFVVPRLGTHEDVVEDAE